MIRDVQNFNLLYTVKGIKVQSSLTELSVPPFWKGQLEVIGEVPSQFPIGSSEFLSWFGVRETMIMSQVAQDEGPDGLSQPMREELFSELRVVLVKGCPESADALDT